MWPDWVSNPGPLTYEPGALQTALRGPACEMLICKLVYLFIVFGEHGRYIGNINHLW